MEIIQINRKRIVAPGVIYPPSGDPGFIYLTPYARLWKLKGNLPRPRQHHEKKMKFVLLEKLMVKKENLPLT
ncbi:MAG: hypothetical protein LBJ31_03700 [Treponema sp.]|jgi:hypothetical protein|nr:hypothetical protein [Treponema sp.]